MKKRHDKKFKEFQKEHGDRLRKEGRHLDVVDTGTQILVRAAPNPVRQAPWVPNVKGMRWQDGVLVPRKGGPK